MALVAAMLPSLAFFTAWLGLTLAVALGPCPSSRQRSLPPAIAAAVALATIQLVLTLFALAGILPIGLAFTTAASVVLVAWQLRNRPPTHCTRRVDPAAVAIIALVVAVAAPTLLRPHVSYDVLSYHLPLAERAWTRAGLAFQPGNYYSLLPMGAAVLEASLVSKGVVMPADLGVRVLILAVLAACVLAAGDVARKLGGQQPAALIAMVLVATHPLAWKTLLNAYTDGMVALYGLAGLWLLVHGTAPRRHASCSLLLTAGVLGGSAMAIKFSALFIVAVPQLIALVVEDITSPHRGCRARFWTIPRHAIVPAAGWLVGYAPWFVRAALNGVGPLFPFLGSSVDWSADQARFVAMEHDPRLVWSLAYWRGVVEGIPVFDIDLAFAEGTIVVPVAVAMAVAGGLLPGRRCRRTAMALAMGLTGYLAWRVVAGAPDRFVMLSVFLVMILAALASWPRGAHRLWRIGAGGLLLVAWMATLIPNRDLYRVAWYPQPWSREGMIPSRLLKSIWADVEKGDRVLLLFEARARLFPRNSEVTTVWDVPPWFALLREAPDEAAFEGALAERGYTHLVVNEVEWGRLVSFYGDLDRPMAWDAFSVGLRPREVEELLRAYPPMKHAGATDEEIARLAMWLRRMRERATMVEPMGLRAELWWAPITAGS